MEDSRMSFGDHLEVFRKMLMRVLSIMTVCATVIFCFKDTTFSILLAPKDNNFITFKCIEKIISFFGGSFTFDQYNIQLISTELSSQFMVHLESSFVLGALLSSPYIIYEIYKFIAPALYENEKKYSNVVCGSAYLLFIVGVLMNYYVLFPIAFRFLATYQVADAVISTITISSYISTFTSLCLTMGIVFELPVLGFLLAKLGLLKASFMKKYRRHSIIVIMVVAAFITPPDVFTLCLVTIPLYSLYEFTILIVDKVQK